MQKFKHSRLLPITGLLLGMLVWLANDGNPPTGRTAAPFDMNCNGCHNGNSYNGTIDVTGFPATANPDQLYDINVKLTVSSGAPTIAGMQMVVVDANNADCGDLIEGTADLGTEFMNSREYMEHRGGKTISGGTVEWDFQWRAPLSVPGNTVKVYYIVNMCNNNNGSGGDNPVWSNLSFGFSGPPPVSASISSTVNPSCNGGNNGSATVEASGGNPPYTYLWSGGGQTGQTATNLVAGTYTCTVTASGGSGTATAVAVLTAPPALTLSTTVTGSVTCVTSATATATGGGGTPGYTYLWSDGQTGNVAVFEQTGSYSVTLTDANGCTKIASANITGNTTPPLAVAGADGELTCATPQTQLNGAGSSTGTNITYLWTTSGGNIVSGANTLTPTVNGCGTYTLLVTNIANGCTATDFTTVVCNTNPPNATASGGTITCSDLEATLMGSSTTPGATFAWAGPGITPQNQFQQNPEVGLPGLYTLTVTNPEDGCTKTATATVNTNTTQPSAVATVSGTLTCLVTSVQLNLTTNAPNPIYLWMGPNGFSSNVANPSVSFPGVYTGTVINPANGCQNSAMVTVVQNIAAPGASAAVSGQINCTNSTVQLLGNSPLAPDVTYLWLGQNFNTNQQNPTTGNPGTYNLTVTGNVNGCTSTASVTVVQNIAVPFDSIVPPGNLNCNNPSIQLNGTPSSQGPSFDYLWTAKEGGSIVSGDTTLTPVVDSTGKYFLKITNVDNGCTALDSVVVNQSLPVTAALAASTNVACNGGSNGSATLSGSGGNGVFTYLWSNGATTATATGLAAGTYGGTVTDGENCTASISVSITQPNPLLPNASATPETANNANNGTATANPNGGTVAYTYTWSNAATTQTITNLAPGSYTVSVVDANGCTAVETVTVNAFGCSLAATAASTNVTCNGANDGTASITTTGAANPVSYAWSNGATTQSVSNLSPGVFTVNIVDGNNCPAVLSVSISEPTLLSANASATGVTANGANDGTATAAPIGGTPNYQYAWSNGGTNQSISGLAPGTYTVVVTDNNGCTSAQTVNVAAFNCALSAAISASNVLCFGGTDGQATMVINGGTLPYTYLWSNGATTQTASNLSVGTYSVAATDAAGCAVGQSVSITQPDQLQLTVATQNVLCPQDNNGSATISGTGGTAPYTYDIPGNPASLGVGTYTVVVTDANNCTATASFTIEATDSQAPTLICPSNLPVCGPSNVNYGTPTVADNCGVEVPAVVISGPTSGAFFDEGVTTVVYQATDVSGNTSTCSFSVVVNSVPSIQVDNVSNDLNGQGLGSISITPMGNGAFTYAWSKDGQAFATTEDLTGLNAGSYFLVMTDQNGCTVTLTPIVITNTVGTNEPSLVGAVRLWPNPANVSIQLEIIDLDVIAASIVDLRGRLVQVIQPAEILSEIEVKHLPEGMYCLKLSTANGRVVSLKFLKKGN